jgi:hypothetical protein
MGRLILYLSILSAVFIVLGLLGIIEHSSFGAFFTLLSKKEEFFTSAFFKENLSAVLSIAGAAAAGLVSIGFIATGKGDMAIKAPIAALLLPIGHDIVALFITLKNMGTVTATIGEILVIPMAVLFVLAVIDWWGGTG